MENVVVIGASYLQLPLIKMVKDLGYKTHVFALANGAVKCNCIDHFYDISVREIDEIYEVCKKIKPIAIVSIALDLTNINEISSRLGLICNSKECLKVTTNKYEMREALSKKGISCPSFVVVNSKNDLKDKINLLNFPVIVKPTDRSGSRAVTKLHDANEIEKAVEQAIESSFEGKSIIEEYIEGDEFSMETISFRGVHFPLTITKKFTTGSPHFIEVGHMEPAGLSDKQVEMIKNQIVKALSALRIKNGASHTKFKLDKEGNVKIIEIGSRGGGDLICSSSVKLSTGVDFLKLIFDVALGKKPKFETSSNKVVCVKYICSDKDYKQINNFILQNQHKIIEYNILNYTNYKDLMIDYMKNENNGVKEFFSDRKKNG